MAAKTSGNLVCRHIAEPPNLRCPLGEMAQHVLIGRSQEVIVGLPNARKVEKLPWRCKIDADIKFVYRRYYTPSCVVVCHGQTARLDGGGLPAHGIAVSQRTICSNFSPCMSRATRYDKGAGLAAFSCNLGFWLPIPSSLSILPTTHLSARDHSSTVFDKSVVGLVGARRPVFRSMMAACIYPI